MQNKGLFITLGVVILIIVSGLGIFYFVSARNATAPVKNSKNFINAPQIPVMTLSPDAIGFSMAIAETGKSAGHAMDIKIAKLEGITGIDYEFSYIYSGDLNQGGFGHIDIKSGDTSVSKQIVLGTCSSGVCRYDKEVSHFKVILRITKEDGKTYEVQKEMGL